METNEIKELMLSGEISYIDNSCSLICEDLKGNGLEINAEPLDGFFDTVFYDSIDEVRLTDEQHDMICEYITQEYYEYHSNNSAFTDDDKEHFNSLI
mgnify:FL=1|tara:strand:- start:482 stop:772 length:291 start_codon:yes stop_codon:yes gene_type:complete